MDGWGSEEDGGARGQGTGDRGQDDKDGRAVERHYYCYYCMSVERRAHVCEEEEEEEEEEDEPPSMLLFNVTLQKKGHTKTSEGRRQ